MAKYKIIPSSRTIVQSPISIGHKAEKGVEAIEFDLTAWVETYGSGTLTVIMRRWGDAIPYPIALEIGENNKATWTLSDIDTAKAGMAYAQLSYIVGDEVVKKSDIYTFRVMDSLTGEGEPPEAYESWLEHLTHLAAEAMAEVLDIEGIVTDKTLTVDGGIADGKATGDALSALEDQFTEETDQLKANLGAFVEPPRLDNGTDLNNVMTPGVYLLHTNNTYENKPTSDVEHGILEVWDENMPNNSGRIFQRLTYTFKAGRTSGEIWTRSYSRQSQSWTAWQTVGNDLSEITEVIQTTVRQTVYTPISYNIKSVSTTVNGITFTQNTNHKVTVVGTATANTTYSLIGTNNIPLEELQVIGGRTYRLRGCPSGGSNSTYRLDLRTISGGGTVICIDTGEGILFTPESTGTLYPSIRIAGGITVNLVFEMVLEEQSYAEAAGTPIKTAIDVVARSRIDTVEENQDDITEVVQTTVRQTVYTPISYSMKNDSTTVNGITFAQGTNHKVTVTGTATNNAMYALLDTQGNKLGIRVTSGKMYRLRGCPSGGSNNTYRLDLRTATSSGTVVCVDTGEGVLFAPESTGYLYPLIRIGSGETVNLVFEMILEEQSYAEAASDLVKTAIDVIARSRIEEYESSAVSLTPNIKRAILACFQHVRWDDEGYEYYTALESALNESESNEGGA